MQTFIDEHIISTSKESVDILSAIANRKAAIITGNGVIHKDISNGASG